MTRILSNGLTERSIRVDIGYNPVDPDLVAVVLRCTWGRRYIIYVNVPVGVTAALENGILDGLADFANMITTPSSFVITVSGLPVSAIPMVDRLRTLTLKDENDAAMKKLADALMAHNHAIGWAKVTNVDCKITRR